VHRQHPFRVLGGVRGSLPRKQREGMMSAIPNLDLLFLWYILFCYSMSCIALLFNVNHCSVIQSYVFYVIFCLDLIFNVLEWSDVNVLFCYIMVAMLCYGLLCSGLFCYRIRHESFAPINA
jgi:hypothetical protein